MITHLIATLRYLRRRRFASKRQTGINETYDHHSAQESRGSMCNYAGLLHHTTSLEATLGSCALECDQAPDL